MNRIDLKSPLRAGFLAVAVIGVTVAVGLVIWQSIAREKAEARPANPTVSGATNDEIEPINVPAAEPFTIRFGSIEPPVVAQRDITVSAPMSLHNAQKAPLECSSIAWLNGRLVMSSDRHRHLLFVCPVDEETMTIGEPTHQVVVRNEQWLLDDAEAIELHRNARGEMHAYVMCSLSNDNAAQSLPKRRHFMRVRLGDGRKQKFDDARVLDASGVRARVNDIFNAAHVAPYRSYNAEMPGDSIDAKNTYRWGNVEGIAFTPGGVSLLCGMRNPLVNGKAIIFALRNVPTAFDNNDETAIGVNDLFLLDLDNRGVSEIKWDPVTHGYLILAAKSNGPRRDMDQPYPPNNLDAAMFWWSGQKGEKPTLVAHIPDMKVEAICRIGMTRYVAIASDEGDVSEGRAERQSVLTIFRFEGIAATDEASDTDAEGSAD